MTNFEPSASASSASSQNDLLCRLRLSLDTIFDDKKQISEKISNLLDIATLPPGACGGGIKPLAVMFLSVKETEYFGNVVSENSGNQTRTDTFYTVTAPAYVSSNYNDIFMNDRKNVVAGQANIKSWGSDLLWDKTKKAWPASFTALLKKDLLKQIVGSYDEKKGAWTPTVEVSSMEGEGDPAAAKARKNAAVDDDQDVAAGQPSFEAAGQSTPITTTENTNDLLKDYLILGPFNSTNLYDYKNNTYVSVQEIQIIRGSDKLYYKLEALPKDQRDLNKVLYKLSVFKTRAMAERARNDREMEDKK